jgi:RNA polymerase sigma factor (TIGR02999 family)
MNERIGAGDDAVDSGDVTALLLEWSDGDRGALDRLMPLVYGELRRLAARSLRRERRAESLQPTALVHEAYIDLIDQNRVQWRNRRHFYAVAAQAIRRILVDHARARLAVKRGGGIAVEELEGDVEGPRGPAPIDVLALEAALERLAASDPEGARLIELRFYGGLSLEEIAELVGRSMASVKRDLRAARAFLHRELGILGPAP